MEHKSLPLRHGGDRVAEVLHAHGVPFVFTLCGGHISPITVAAKRLGIRVVDTRDEATAVFAADAVARLTGAPASRRSRRDRASPTRSPPLKNAQLAQSRRSCCSAAAHRPRCKVAARCRTSTSGR